MDQTNRLGGDGGGGGTSSDHFSTRRVPPPFSVCVGCAMVGVSTFNAAVVALEVNTGVGRVSCGPSTHGNGGKAESNHGAGIEFWGATSRFTNFFRKFLNFGPEKPLLTIVQGSIFQESIPELSKIVQE